MTHTIDYDALAKKAAGNWQKFDCFVWHRAYDLKEPEKWCIVYTHNRDSRLCDKSNSEAIEKEMKPFLGKTAIKEDHNHWGCGWVAGYSIKVYKRDGSITKAFMKWCDIQDALSDYPLLDEEDYSKKEYEATLENIEQAAVYAARKLDIELPDDFAGLMFNWFWNNLQIALENRDDQGGYPSEEECIKCFEALGWDKPEEDSNVENPT